MHSVKIPKWLEGEVTVVTLNPRLMVIILTNNRMFYANIFNLLKSNLMVVFSNFVIRSLPMSFV